MQRSFKELLHLSYKSEDTEEWFDIHFNRPIGLVFALMWKKLGVHPNAVTILSFFLGAGAGVMFYFPDLTHNIIGVVLLVFANFCDSTDGQLARITGKKTLLGRMLDGLGADVWYVSIYLCLAFRMWNTPIPLTDINFGWWGIVLCAAAGFGSHSYGCQLADYYRQVHLYFLLGKDGAELDNSQAQRDYYKSLPKGTPALTRAFFWNYANYCASQERRTPAFQKFFAHVKSRWADASEMPQELRDDFRAGSLPLMKYTNLLTFNLRAFVLYAACLTNIPWAYPLFEVTVLVAMCEYMHYKHEAHCRRMDAKYFGE